MSDACDVSVVVSTFNRAALLPHTLDSILAQHAGSPSFEIVVVDNNSADDTRAVIESYVAKEPRVRHYSEPRQGVSYGRNTGVANARAAIVAFTDDDLLVAPDWIAVLAAALREHPEADYVGGRVLPKPGQQFPPWLTRLHWNPLMIHDPGPESLVLNGTQRVGVGSGNLAMRRKVFLEFEGFSPDYPRGQDRELQLRLWRAGRQGLYVPSMVVYTEIQSDRFEKAYHRRWYESDGRLGAVIRDEEAEASRARLFDVPAHLYRKAIGDALRWPWCLVTGQSDRAFLAELELRYFRSFYRERRAEFLRKGDEASLGNFARFLRALWGR